LQAFYKNWREISVVVKPGVTNEKGVHTKAFSMQFIVSRRELETELTITCNKKN
jgi:hypothetical protein